MRLRYGRAAVKNVAQQSDLLRLLDDDSLRQPTQPGVVTEQKLQSCHLDRALMVRNHRAREIAVRISAGCDAHGRVHFDHRGTQCAVEPGCRTQSWTGKMLSLHGRRGGDGEQRERDTGQKGAGVGTEAPDHAGRFGSCAICDRARERRQHEVRSAQSAPMQAVLVAGFASTERSLSEGIASSHRWSPAIALRSRANLCRGLGGATTLPPRREPMMRTS